jgi:hypothetical protein
MLNKQVKAGQTVQFKYNGGQTFSAVVKTINGGPDPSGAAVVLDQIAPPIPGHPTMTIDAGEISLPLKHVLALPDGPPFTAPPGYIISADGSKISPRDYYLFDTYEAAVADLDKELAATAKMAGNPQGITGFVADGILGSPNFPASYTNFATNNPPANPPAASHVSVWVIVINVEEISIPAVFDIPAYTGPAQGTDVAGDITDRQLQPNDMDQGPTGDRGGDTLYMRALAPTNAGGGAATLEGYWNPAQQ